MNQRETGRREFVRTAFVAGGGALSCGASVAWAKPPNPPAGLPQVDPKEIRIDPRRLQVAYDLMESWTSGRNAPVPGGAIMVGRAGKCFGAALLRPAGAGGRRRADPPRCDVLHGLRHQARDLHGGDAPRRTRATESQ